MSGIDPDRPKAKRAPAGAAYAYLAIVMLLWAGNSIIGRAVRAEIPPFTLAFVRWSGALALVVPFAASALRRDMPVLRAHWRIVLVLGLLGVASFNAFLYLGLHFTTATNAILIQAAIPPFILIANRLLFRDIAAPLQIVGVALSTFGVGLVVTRADLGVLLGLQFSRGDLFVLCAVVGWSLYTVLLRRRPAALAPLSFIVATFAVGALAMLPLAIGEWASGQRVVWSAATLGAFAYVAVLPSIAGYFLYNTAVGMIGAGRAGQTMTLMPLFGAFLAAAVLGEPLRPYDDVGMALILSGISLAAIGGRRGRRPRDGPMPPC